MNNWEEADFVPDYEEELPTPKIRMATEKNGKKCPACPAKFTHVRRHCIMEHVPWYMYPDTACWECKINMGQKRMLDVHIMQLHSHDLNATNLKFNIQTHGDIWMKHVNEFLSQYNSSVLFDFINSNASFSSCISAVWQETDKELIEMFIQKANLQESHVPEKPFPVSNIFSLFHWKLLTILASEGKNLPTLIPITLIPHKSILMIGSSIVYWAFQRTKSLNCTDLGISNASVQWEGQRGMKWRALVPKLFSLHNSVETAPSLVCIHLGSNDISSLKPNTLIIRMKNDILKCMEMFPNSIVVYSQLLSRRCWSGLLHEEGERRRVGVNQEMSNFTIGHGGKVLLHNNIEWRFKELFRDDGVHLTDKGNDLYIGNLKKAFREFLFI